VFRDEVMDGVYYFARAFVPALVKSGGGELRPSRSSSSVGSDRGRMPDNAPGVGGIQKRGALRVGGQKAAAVS